MAAIETFDTSVILVKCDMHPKTLCGNKYNTLVKVFFCICKHWNLVRKIQLFHPEYGDNYLPAKRGGLLSNYPAPQPKRSCSS